MAIKWAPASKEELEARKPEAPAKPATKKASEKKEE